MACPHSEDQWPHYSNHQAPSYPPQTSMNRYDSNMMTTDSVITTSSSLAPSAASPKPIRRRSRASKKTPTTLLNADASNFRALVQQFTGRPSPPSVIAPGAQRGPVTISFGQGGGFGEGDNQGLVSGPGFNHFGYGDQQQQQSQYDQQRYYGYGSTNPNVEISGSFVGDGLNVDDLDWETISSSTSHANDGHHFF